MGKLTKNEVTVDATLQNLSIKPGDIYNGAGDTPILADGKVKTVLTLSADNKTLTGVINVTLIAKEANNNIWNYIVPSWDNLQICVILLERKSKIVI